MPINNINNINKNYQNLIERFNSNSLDVSNFNLGLDHPLVISVIERLEKHDANKQLVSKSGEFLLPKCVKLLKNTIKNFEGIQDLCSNVNIQIPSTFLDMHFIKYDTVLKSMDVLYEKSIDISFRDDFFKLFGVLHNNVNCLTNLKYRKLMQDKYSFLNDTNPENLYLRNTYSFLEKNVNNKDFIKVAALYGKIVSENNDKSPFMINKMFFEQILEKFYLDDETCPIWMFKVCINQCYISFKENNNIDNKSCYNISFYYSPHLNNNILHKIRYYIPSIITDYRFDGINGIGTDYNPSFNHIMTRDKQKCHDTIFVTFDKIGISEKWFAITPTLFETLPHYAFSCDINQLHRIIKDDFLIPYYNNSWTPFSINLVKNLSFYSSINMLSESTICTLAENFKTAFPVDPCDVDTYKFHMMLQDIFKKVGLKFDGHVPTCVLQNGKKQEILIKAFTLSLRHIKLFFSNQIEEDLCTPPEIVFCKHKDIFTIKEVDFSIDLNGSGFVCELNFTSRSSNKKHCLKIYDSIDYTSDYRVQPSSSMYTKRINVITKNLFKL